MKPSKPTRKRIDAILDDVRAERHEMEDSHSWTFPPAPVVATTQHRLNDAREALNEWPSLPDHAEARAILIEAMALLVLAVESIDWEVSRG